MIGLARDRAQDFRDNWFFSCECQRCQDSTDLGWQSSSWLCESCGDPAPPSSPPQWGGVQCLKCGWEVEEEEVVKIETLLALKVQEGPEDGADGVREWAEDLLAQEDVGRLHPHHALAMIVKMRLMRTPALGLQQMRRKVEVRLVCFTSRQGGRSWQPSGWAKMAKKFLLGAFLLFSRQMRRFCA